MITKIINLFFYVILLIGVISCANHFGSVVIAQPDKHTRIYEAKERVVLKAIAGVLKEKNIGRNVTIDQKNHRVDSDYVESEGWRTKTSADLKQLNWKECEVILAVTTEKKTEGGWEIRRVLEKEQYDNFFNVIDLRIYEEMSRVD